MGCGKTLAPCLATLGNSFLQVWERFIFLFVEEKKLNMEQIYRSGKSRKEQQFSGGI